MTTSWRVRGVAALRAVSCLAVAVVPLVPAVPAAAQVVPVRVVQSGEGALYLVRDGIAWPLVPESISDADLAALVLGGEVDGALPADWLSQPASPAPPAESLAAPAAPAPAPAIAAPAAPAPAAANPPAGAPAAPAPPLRAAAPPPSTTEGRPTVAPQTGSTPAPGGGLTR